MDVQLGVPESFHFTAVLPEAICVLKASSTGSFGGDRVYLSMRTASKWPSWSSASSLQGTKPCPAGVSSTPAQFPCPGL